MWQSKLNNSDSKSKIGVKIKSPKGPGDEMRVLGDLKGSCNNASSIWYVEENTYRSICDNWIWITVTMKVKLMLILIVLCDLCKDNHQGQ